MNWYLAALKKYVDFTGRARRTEYWMFTLFTFLISVALMLVDTVVGTVFLGTLFSLGMLLPGLAVSVRRLHDTGRGGLWLLLVLVPVLGAIVLLIFFVQDSKPGANAYGPNPKEGAPPAPASAWGAR